MGGTTLSSYMGGYPAQQQAQQPAQQPQYWQQFLQNIYGGAPRQMSYQDAASLAFGYDPYGAALQAATQPRYTPPPMPPTAKPTAGPDAGVTAPAGGGGGDANPENTIASGGGQRRGGRIGHSKDVRAAMLTAWGMTPEHFAEGGMARRTRQQPLSVGEDHPAWIPQRLITSVKAQPAHPTDRNIVNLDALKATPELYQKNVDLLRSYPNVRQEVAENGTHDEVAEHFINHVVGNLFALHDSVPEDTRNRSRLWYDGANKIAQDWSRRYNIPIHSAAAALAALSPQKDWFQNVSLAHRVVHAMKGGDNFYKGFAADDKMRNKFNSISSLNKPEYQGIYGLIHGKSLHDISRMDMPPEAKAKAQALFVRLHDEACNPRSYNLVTPEGGYGDLARNADGSPSKVGWGSLTEIAKAIQALEAGKDASNISKLMGEKHKVRNFYNNILSPNSKHGDVTIDTHAVAAGLYRPLAGESLEVTHNFNNYAGKGVPGAGGSAVTGVQGTYPLYAEAYRRAANKRGILPREMQSITWEAVRGLFPDVFKTPKNADRIDQIWNEYKRGRISQKRARSLVNEFAAPEGIRPPQWEAGRPAVVDETHGRPFNEGELPQSGIHGESPAPFVSGTGGGAAAPVQAGAGNPIAAPKLTPGYTHGGLVAHALRLANSLNPVPPGRLRP